ncbi:hypothetical protein F5050DRAFT_1748793 [Lentinula boryana]|uniref:Transcriptional adapter 2 n=1 Tax=Lentinula boryana TaxID=40481 RepID=A0ABQ8QH32_9AGAR|nr:hypothetical protein F5050DRAFT_1748793 [Lentinula boryana]
MNGMTLTQRKAQTNHDDIALHEPGAEYHCDACSSDLTHTIRIKCADPVCEAGDGVDLCPACFCTGKEFASHKRGHPYRLIEISSQPIFSEDWGADEELLLVKGIASHGFGNWKKIAEAVRTHTKEECAAHYNEVYVNSKSWPLPPMDRTLDIDVAEFQDRKRRRIAEMNSAPLPPLKPTPVSLPGIHEITGFFPGRLEFEHEIDHEAEDLVKDLEFGVVMQNGGDQIPEDENDLDVKARLRWEDEKKNSGLSGKKGIVAGKSGKGLANGLVNGHHSSSIVPKETPAPNSGNEEGNEDDPEELTQPPPIETDDSLALKFTLMEMYFQRVEKRLESKSIIYDRGLLEYKKIQAAEKKRPREEREIIHRFRPFARLGTAADYEVFTADILYEALLRKRIKELQDQRRLGLQTAGDVEKFENDCGRRSQIKASNREAFAKAARQSSVPDQRRASLTLHGDDSRNSHDREATPLIGSSSAHIVRRPPAPLNLANSPSLHLLTPGEQALCSQLRILPKPYLVIKETLVREYARRGGKLRRREARDLVKVDVNKTSRVWDFLVQAGFLKITPDVDGTSAPSTSAKPYAIAANGSPVKEVSSTAAASSNLHPPF